MFRRLFVGLAVLILGISVLVVSPAGAANTASESLADHDNDATTAEVRAFGGSNRYATSVALAQAFTAGGGSGGFVESVIVASGESLVDAAAAAGLAAAESAPVLLTTSNRLSRLVETFIIDEFISEVFIVGGTASVSQNVEDAIGELAPVRTVTRLAGADRYATAVAVASEMGSPGVYCETGAVTALLVNVDSSFADVIAVGPLAYSLELPILLTPANALPTVTADYLVDAEIERVVIIGGTAAVSEAVVADITEAGIDDVVRISGANRYDTALEIRQAISDCGTRTLSPNTIALVNGEAAADGVSAGPLLGVGLDNNGITPVLLVDTGGLPSETRDYLSSLPTRNPDSTFVDLDLTAIGGTAVVPASVMSAAISAAVTSSPITTEITANAGETTITITFSDPVSYEAAPGEDGTAAQRAAYATSALNRAHYRVSGGPLLPGDGMSIGNGNKTVTITLANSGRVPANATVTVANGTIKGLGNDGRRAEGASATARAKAPDRVRPNLDIFAPEGSHAIRISVTEPNLDTDVSSTGTDAARQALLTAISIRPASGAAVPLYVAPVAPATTSSSIAMILPSSTQNDITVCLFGLTGTAPAEVCTAVPVPTPAVDDGNPRAQVALATGETVTVAAEAFMDDSDNESRSESQRVTAYTSYPRATRVTVSEATTLNTGTPTAPVLENARWIWQRTGVNTDGTDDINVLTITAKAGGAASGALGNGWFVGWNPTPTDTDTVPEASTSINEQRRTISINFDDDATVFSVVRALAGNSDFSELFTVSSDAFGSSDAAGTLATEKITGLQTTTVACAGQTRPTTTGETLPCGQPDITTRRALNQGVSVVTVTLTYNEPLMTFDYATLLTANGGDAKFPLEARDRGTVTDDAMTATDESLLGWVADPFAAVLDLRTEFSFTLTTDSPSLADLPTTRDTISLPAALAVTFAPADCTGLTPIGAAGVNDCGSSIAVADQRLRRG